MSAARLAHWLLRARPLALALAAATALLMTVGAGGAWASRGQVLVYDNQTAYDPGFTHFGEATDNTVVTLSTLPEELGSYACVLLNLDQSPFSSVDIATLTRYLAGGGSVIAIGDLGLFGARADATLNTLVGSLGGHMALKGDFVDTGFAPTTNIDSSPLTAGVSSIQYAGASTLTVSGPATSLVRTRRTGLPLVAAESLDGGRLVLFGDSNIASDDSSDGYTSHDNGALMRNVCGDEPIHVTGLPVAGTEGRPFDGTVATVVGDPDSGPSDLAVTIDWGDGSHSAGSVDPAGNVTGSHTYAEEGSYTVTTTVADSDSSSNTATASSTATVDDAPLSATGTTVSSQPSFAGAVASFDDQNPGARASDFTATVDWGDGASGAGTVSRIASGQFEVTASHTYSDTGPHALTVDIADGGGSTAEAAGQILTYEFAAPNGGSFAVADEKAAIGSQVVFWGSGWAAENPLGTGLAPPSFKGYGGVPSSAPPACGGSFSALPGGSGSPPPDLPAYLGVYVTGAVSKHGPGITGDIAHIVIVRTDPGYQPDPSQPGSGQVVAQVC